MTHFSLDRWARAGTVAFVALATAQPAQAASTMPLSAWGAWAASSTINKCFSWYPPRGPLAMFDPQKQSAHGAPPKPVALDHATYTKIATGALAATTFATVIALPKTGFGGTVFSAEREGDFVAWSLQQPGGTTDGFLPAAGAPSQIATGTGTAVAAFRKSVPPAVMNAAGQSRCGYTLVRILDAKYPSEEESGFEVLLERGHITGFIQTEGP